MKDLNNKKVAVVGLGASGYEAALFLKSSGALVSVTDNNYDTELHKKREELKEAGIRCELGGHTEAALEGAELMVLSPGIDNMSLPVTWAEKNGVPVISEIELAYRFCKAPIVAITGTNGKSTVTSLIGEILRAGGRNTFVCGNIGRPFISIVSTASPEDIVVLEISSFQLDRIDKFKPHIALVLNITPDHLDRYSDIKEYTRSKLRIFENQEREDCAIINYDQARCKGIKDLRSRTLYFSKYTLPKGLDGAFVENNELVMRKDSRYIWFATREFLSLGGDHNLENSLVAGLAALVAGADAETVKETLYNFKGLDHRFELVGTVKGVKFVDDSKATNVDSVRRAIQASPMGIILIAGGRDKGGDYRVLKKLLKDKVKSMFLIGEAKDKIKESLSGAAPISYAETLEEAVSAAFSEAKNGDTVMLSPMCSSFDMFSDYKARGRVFREAVEGLKQNK